MKMYEILIPTVDNDGNYFPTHHHHAWDEEIIKRFGGLTILKSPFKGKWMNNRKLEVMIPVRIACKKEDLLTIMGDTAQHYKQKQMMAYEVSPEVIFFP